MTQGLPHTHRWLTWLLCVWLAAGSFLPTMAQQGSSNGKAVVSPEASLAPSLLKEGLALYEEMEWETATAKLKAALKAGLPPEDAAQANWYLAVIARAEGDLEVAEDYLVETLRIKPDFKLPATLLGTDFEAIYKNALQQTDQTPPDITIGSTPDVERGSTLRITAEITDASPITQVRFSYVSPTKSTPTTANMTQASGNRWTVEIPGEATRKVGELSFEVSATDTWQNEAQQSGSARILKGEGGGKGMLLVIGGAIVAAGGGLAALLLGGGSDTPANDDDDDDNGNDPIVDGTWPQSSAPLPPQ